MTLGPGRDSGDALVVAPSWVSSGLSGLLPVLDGDMELVPLNPNRCRVTLCVSYVPPFGGLGRQLDRALLHRVARSTVGSFLARVARSLEDENLG